MLFAVNYNTNFNFLVTQISKVVKPVIFSVGLQFLFLILDKGITCKIAGEKGFEKGHLVNTLAEQEKCCVRGRIAIRHKTSCLVIRLSPLLQ